MVQRAILNVLQDEKALDPYYKIPTSFGGIKGKGLGVPGAVKAAYNSIRNGAKYFICSDIEGFFTKVPKNIVLEKIKSVITDQKFNDLIQEAVQTELENLDELGKQADAFPIYEVGVAQGCCLSPIMGNILLEEFDSKLNDRGVICLRYIDDFLILGPNKRKVVAAFESGKRILAEFGLSAYDPFKDKDKAEQGYIKSGFDFLGCEIRPGEIRPNPKSKERLLHSVSEILTKSKVAMDQPKHLLKKKLTLIETLSVANNVMKGWGNQYSFCNDPVGLQNLDRKIDELLLDYWKFYSENQRKWDRIDDAVNSRRLLGVHVLEKDSKHDPIIKR
ncbi:MAG: reverse transcriptase domain-containing protein [Nitrospirales bacterium]|nr:reverse transcriptase domain-containing protein [Nitrospirales bacterium]